MYYCEIDEKEYCFHTTQNELPLTDRIVLSDWDAFGMIYDPETGTFFGYTPPEPEPMPEPEPTQLDRIEEQQLTIMEALADQYEQQQETNLVNMEVQATIYEELLAIQESEVQ